MEKSLDIANYIRFTKQIKIMLDVLFTRDERALIKRNKHFILQRKMSSSSESDQPEGDFKDAERLQKVLMKG